jgi:hypothetical protein
MVKRSTGTTHVLLTGVALACVASTALADPVRPGSHGGLGLIGNDVPEPLRKIAADPYAAPGDCAQIDVELHKLEAILGPDFDSGKRQAAYTWVDAAGTVARSFIPYRTVVRLVTGANRKDAELTQASMAGWERRGFLKGLQKHCEAAGQRDATAAGQPAADVTPQPVVDPAPPAALPRAMPINNVAAPAPAQDGAPPVGQPAAFPDRRPAATYQMTVAAEPGR